MRWKGWKGGHGSTRYHFQGIADEQEEDDEERTKSLIKLLPRFIAKTQTYPARMSAVLGLVGQLKVEVYLDLRKTSVSALIILQLAVTFG
jgi:hypothetical protein